MADRNSIIEKIKALLAKTTANGCTEAEMLAALDKAAAMQDAYDIADEDLRLAKEEAAMLHAEPPDLKDPHGIKWRLCRAVGEFCGVQIYRHSGETGLRCIGMPSDVQFALWLLDSLCAVQRGQPSTRGRPSRRRSGVIWSAGNRCGGCSQNCATMRDSTPQTQW